MIRAGEGSWIFCGASRVLCGEEMSPLFMDSVCEPNSPGSLSAEESHSNTAGSEREGEGQRTEKRGMKRQEKNRDAARKSRRKQTARADELHEELQCLERSNSALQKEIAMLKKDFDRYTTALERHEPFCCLRESASSSQSTTHLEPSPSANCEAASLPHGAPHHVPTSTQAAAPSLSTSSTPSLGPQTLECFLSTHLSSSTPVSTCATLAPCSSSSLQLFTTSSPVTAPHSVSFATVPFPHSLFSPNPPPLITSRLTNVPPVCTSLISKPAPSSSLTTAAQQQSRRDAISKHSSMTANAHFSRPHPGAVEAPLMKQTSFLQASSDVVPSCSHFAAENASLVEQGCPMDVPQPHSDLFSGNPINSSLPHFLSTPDFPDPLQSISVSPQANQEPSPTSIFASKSSYSKQVVPSPVSLLSLLTSPNPLNVSQTTSSILDASQPPPSLPLLGDSSRDLSLSELLEVNDWILE